MPHGGYPVHQGVRHLHLLIHKTGGTNECTACFVYLTRSSLFPEHIRYIAQPFRRDAVEALIGSFGLQAAQSLNIWSYFDIVEALHLQVFRQLGKSGVPTRFLPLLVYPLRHTLHFMIIAVTPLYAHTRDIWIPINQRLKPFGRQHITNRLP